jgi:hypothetical protein
VTTRLGVPPRLGDWRRPTWRFATTLAVVGLTLEGLALVLLVLNLPSSKVASLGSNGLSAILAGLTFPIIGWLIATRRPENPIGWMFLVVAVSLSLVGFAGMYAAYGLITDPGSLPFADFASWVSTWAWVPGYMVLAPLVLLFPDGRLPSPRWKPVLWLAGLSFVVTLAASMIATWQYRGLLLLTTGPPESTQDTLTATAMTIQTLGLFLTLPVALAAVAAVAVRFRRSSGIERKQLKWFASGAIAMMVLLWVATGPIIPAPFDTIAVILITPLLPLATAIAVLRYRLYEIDRFVSRTIAYTVVTALLLAAYAAMLLVLEGPLGMFTGGDTVPVVLSTLAVFALFQPIRHRVQRAVDRRFDRARYDADRTTATFSDRLRDRIDLPSVAVELEVAVQDSMAPASLVLWLRGDVK